MLAAKAAFDDAEALARFYASRADALDKNTSLEDAYPKLGLAYVWGNFGNFLTVSAGKIVDNVWGTEGDWDDGYDGQGLLRFEIKPADGLSFGFSLGNNTRLFNAVPLTTVFSNWIIGAKYANEAAGFSVVAAAKFDYGETYDEVYVDLLTSMDSDPQGSVVGKQDPNGPSKSADLAFSVKYTGVPKLSIALDGQVTQLGAKKEEYVISYDPSGDPDKKEKLNPGYADVRLKIGYQIVDPLSVSLLVKMFAADAMDTKGTDVRTDDKKVLVTPFYIAPGVMYNIVTGLYAGLEARFYMDKVEDLDYVRANGGISLDHKIGWKDEDFSYSIVPQAVLALNEQAVFVFYDEISIEDGDLRNVFGCNFRWKF
jgi:hypothetical protein